MKNFRTSIKDGCNNCRCNDGLVACAYTSITEGCLYFESKESTTSPPNGCKFEGQYRYDGEVFVGMVSYKISRITFFGHRHFA